jgi:heptaprenylglyceryl phosphate synthase
MKANNFPGKKSIALLLDPDKASGDALKSILKSAAKCKTDFIMTGGSLTFRMPDTCCSVSW